MMTLFFENDDAILTCTILNWMYQIIKNDDASLTYYFQLDVYKNNCRVKKITG